MEEILQEIRKMPVIRILSTGLVLGATFTLWLEWGSFSGDWWLRGLARVGCCVLGGLVGWALDIGAAGFTGLGLNMVRGTGFEFSDNVAEKLRNSFIFVCALVAGFISLLFVK